MNISQTFPAYIDYDGKIIQQGYGNSQHIGWSIQKYDEITKLLNEALDKAEKYKQQLIDAGLLQPTLTPEEQIKILTQQVSLLSQQVSTLVSLKENKNDKPKPNNQSG